MEVTNDTLIEDLVEEIPKAIDYLKDKGIRCIRCGEPIWGTLEEAAREKGFGDEDIRRFVEEINQIKDEPNGNSGYDQKINPDPMN
ncbi:MAG: hypothetical protein K9J27_02685 [Bacteroidales bacterium]|nr:hypothetical protein [Bacteroidales bacterium]MCF8332845.1 hypothetical protein [Bacteroidales bacterium]